MSYTKRDIIFAALAELGLSSYEFDLSIDQLDQALVRLDSMMGEWNARGIKLGYNLPSTSTGSNLSDDSGIPDSAWEAAITNLACRLAPSYGKTVSVQTMITARQSWNTVLAICANPIEMKLGRVPSGAGNKEYMGTFVVPEEIDVVERPEQSITFQ